MTRRINLTPTWVSLLPMMLLVLEQGETEAAKQAMRDELLRMAQAADKWNAYTREFGK